MLAVIRVDGLGGRSLVFCGWSIKFSGSRAVAVDLPVMRVARVFVQIEKPGLLN